MGAATLLGSADSTKGCRRRQSAARGRRMGTRRIGTIGLIPSERRCPNAAEPRLKDGLRSRTKAQDESTSSRTRFIFMTSNPPPLTRQSDFRLPTLAEPARDEKAFQTQQHRQLTSLRRQRE